MLYNYKVLNVMSFLSSLSFIAVCGFVGYRINGIIGLSAFAVIGFCFVIFSRILNRKSKTYLGGGYGLAAIGSIVLGIYLITKGQSLLGGQGQLLGPVLIMLSSELQFMRKKASFCYDVSENGNYKGIVEYLASGGDPNKSIAKGFTPLHVASGNGYGKCVEVLIENGANVNAQTILGTTSLMLSMDPSKHEISSLLLKAGADPNLGTETVGPLEIAAGKGNAEDIKMLINFGAEPNGGDGKSSPIVAAAQDGRCEIVKLLLENGADPNSGRTNTGASALFMAAQEGHLETVNILLTAGADPDAPRFDGYKAIDAAKHLGHKMVVESLEKI